MRLNVFFSYAGVSNLILTSGQLEQGWYALRREWKKATSIFLGLGVAFLGFWFAVWDSAMFRWAFTTWWFFGMLYCLSLALLISAFVLAVICRRNFGKNLDHYCTSIANYLNIHWILWILLIILFTSDGTEQAFSDGFHTCTLR